MKTSLAIAIAILLGTATARGDNRADAERYFRAGAKAYAAQSFAAAVANFEEAYKAMPVPEIAFSAAQAYRRLYRIDAQAYYVQRAVELYRIYLDKVKSGGRVGDAADSLGEMQLELDKLKARGASTRHDTGERTRLGVNLSIADQAAAESAGLREIGDATGKTHEGITVAIDGKTVEPFAMIDVSEGDHVVTASAEGYFSVEKKQRAVKGVSALVDVELRPKPAKVKVKTEDDAKILIDGRVANSSALELPAGKHLITVVRSGRQPFGKEIAVGRGEDVVIDAPLEKTSRRRAVKWVVGGASVLGVLAGLSGIGAVAADSKAGDLRAEMKRGNASPDVANAYDDRVRERNDLRTSAIVFGGAALAAGTVGFFLYSFDTPSTYERSHVESIGVTPTAGGASVSVSGRF